MESKDKLIDFLKSEGVSCENFDVVILQQDNENYHIRLKGEEVYKNIILPIEELLGILEKIELSYCSIIKLSNCINTGENCESEMCVLSRILGVQTDLNNLFSDCNEGENEIGKLLHVYKKLFSGLNNPLVEILLEIIERQKDNITLGPTLSIDNFEEIPSFYFFINLIKKEISEYLGVLYFSNALGKNDILSKLRVIMWLRNQKSSQSSYIELPFFSDVYKKIESAKRHGRVGQVVVKGPPGTGKTRIFEYLGRKEGRRVRVISMHQYINYYELLVQNTNLSPAKNRIEGVSGIIKSIEQKKAKDFIEELSYLFDKNKDRFPTSFTLLDFINNIFLVNGFSKSVAKLDSLDDPESVKVFAIKVLNFWRSEESFELLMNKKELIKGQLLSCIDSGEIPVLDEIDKVNEKEIEGILSFLDLETGKSHKIPGFDKEIFIPQWYGIYATSNDIYKPTGSLGRRFNSVNLDYLDTHNSILYLLARILDNKFEMQFNDNEMNQILTCIDIISDLKRSGKYNLMDFSLRMLDNFISGFVTFKDSIAYKTHSVSNRSTYILEALRNAFSLQTEDIYGKRYTVQNTLGEQKDIVVKEINNRIDSILSSRSLGIGVKMSNSKDARVLYLLRKISLDNPILNRIYSELFGEFNTKQLEQRELNFSEELSLILLKTNSLISDSLGTTLDKEEDVKFASEDFVVRSGDFVFQYLKDENQFMHSKDGGSNFIIRNCDNVSMNKEKNQFVINEGDIHILISINGDKPGIEELKDLKECYFDGNFLIKKGHSGSISNGELSFNLPESDSFKINKESGLIEIVGESTLSFYFTDFDKFKNFTGRTLKQNNFSLSVADLGYKDGAKIESYQIDNTVSYLFLKIKVGDSEVNSHIIKFT